MFTNLKPEECEGITLNVNVFNSSFNYIVFCNKLFVVLQFTFLKCQYVEHFKREYKVKYVFT